MQRIDYTAMTAGQMINECGDDAAKWAAAFMQHIAKRNGDFNEADMIGWFANAMVTNHDVKSRRKTYDPAYMTGSEAVYGFAAWLTTRKEATTMGSSHDCAPIVPLIKTFCETNGLAEPRTNWTNFFQHPKEAAKATVSHLDDTKRIRLKAE